MRLFRRPWFLTATALTGGIVAALVLLVPAGCSDCARDCPNTIVRIMASENVDLDLPATGAEGPACPRVPPRCQGDRVQTLCSYVDVIGVAPGICDVFLDFGDRPTMVVRTQFTTQPPGTCCRGFPVIGENLFIVPVDNPDAGITGPDGAATDAVWIYDAGNESSDAAADAGVTDGGDAS